MIPKTLEQFVANHPTLINSWDTVNIKCLDKTIFLINKNNLLLITYNSRTEFVSIINNFKIEVKTLKIDEFIKSFDSINFQNFIYIDLK